MMSISKLQLIQYNFLCLESTKNLATYHHTKTSWGEQVILFGLAKNAESKLILIFENELRKKIVLKSFGVKRFLDSNQKHANYMCKLDKFLPKKFDLIIFGPTI